MMLPARKLLALLALSWLAGCGDPPPTPAASGAAGPTGPAAVLTEEGFEDAEAGSPPAAPWHSNDFRSVVLPVEGCAMDAAAGFPVEGRRWLRVHAGDHGPSTMEDYLATASAVWLPFRRGAQGKFLALEVAFNTPELPGRGSDDFLAIDLFAGDTRANVLVLRASRATFARPTCDGLRSTGRMPVVADLDELFPACAPDTSFTLRISVANAGDAAMDSHAYVDRIRLLRARPLEGIVSRIVQSGTDLWTLETRAPEFPGAMLFHLFSSVPAEPTGSGPFFGLALAPGVLEQLHAPLGLEPVHVRLDATGTYRFGPFPAPRGLRIDYLAMGVADGRRFSTPVQSVGF